MFDKILIANRGEIACRIARTAKRMGIATVAVYSDADVHSRHVALADEAFRIGPPSASDSYLRADRIVEAAKHSAAQAIHPGYGFLAENAAFAERCADSGVTFIGPPAAAIRAMGDKSAAKSAMEKAGVPTVPGYHGDDQAEGILRSEAGRIGYPVMIKASAGGGGKGMRAVAVPGEFAAALAACRREAKAAFGDDRVLLEKYLERPRHIEVQIFADRHGECIHLFERDCSVQRRHQKVIEEAPAPGVSAERRREMGGAAVAAAQAVDYVGAGTVEFIVDRAGRFYFMEMNTRLQVEHPVTEMITGLDLVEWQLRVASGEPLPAKQGDLRIDGHALEARVYAEDPSRDFLPGTGRIRHLSAPAESRQVRVDSGVRAGDTVTPYYDSMIAKLIVHDRDRARAVERLAAALGEFEVAGLVTNLELLGRLARCGAFVRAELDTGLMERHRDELLAPPEPPSKAALVLAALAAQLAHAGERPSPWSVADGWRLGASCPSVFVFSDRVAEHRVEIDAAVEGKPEAGGRLSAKIDGARLEGRVIRAGKSFDVFLPGEHRTLELHDPLERDFEAGSHGGSLAAPLPGKIAAVLVEPGAKVEKGAPLLVLEAMKMEHTIAAPSRGTVAAVRCKAGDQVIEGAELVDFETEAS
ncbi:MAG TPA: acetyl/propionyl/methylcrotonyl-CoA carboxylase subunit alpha [Burkholderiales bacterium]|nr:acetyl/propionyl/methylcrotonyl-CoA carboxylase subunit alpha [Burkholderiales bacterium]